MYCVCACMFWWRPANNIPLFKVHIIFHCELNLLAVTLTLAPKVCTAKGPAGLQCVCQSSFYLFILIFISRAVNVTIGVTWRTRINNRSRRLEISCFSLHTQYKAAFRGLVTTTLVCRPYPSPTTAWRLLGQNLPRLYWNTLVWTPLVDSPPIRLLNTLSSTGKIVCVSSAVRNDSLMDTGSLQNFPMKSRHRYGK
jgi:hypothetical protein